MNTIKTNTGENIDDYENMAVQKSNVAKRVAAGAAVFVGGAANGEGADGFRLQFKIMKNKTAPCNRGGGFITYRYATGLDWVNDLLEIALTFDFIHRVNNVTYELINLETGELYTDENGNQLRGKKQDLIDYIKTNIKFQNEYLAMLNRYISASDASYGSLLDERAAAEIDNQEAVVGEGLKEVN